MATIDITKAHSLPVDQARGKAEELAKSLQERLSLDWKWSGNTIDFASSGGMAKGMKGQVAVSEKNVRVTVDLPFMLRVMKGTIEDKINQKLSELL